MTRFKTCLRFRWTPTRRRIVDLVARGWTHVAIAQHLGIHRNTVRNLLQRDEVRQKLAERQVEFVRTTNLRRLHQISTALIRVDRLVDQQLTAFERGADQDTKALKTFRTLSNEKRALAKAERKELDAIEAAYAFKREVETASAPSTFGSWLSTARGQVANMSRKAPGKL